jgi:hypothetical protein
MQIGEEPEKVYFECEGMPLRGGRGLEMVKDVEVGGS